MKIAVRISKFNRRRKWEIFIKQFEFDNETEILDVGFNNVEDSQVDNYLEKVYPYSEKITAWGVDSSELFKAKYPKVNAVIYN